MTPSSEAVLIIAGKCSEMTANGRCRNVAASDHPTGNRPLCSKHAARYADHFIRENRALIWALEWFHYFDRDPA